MKKITNALLKYRCAVECLIGSLGFVVIAFLCTMRNQDIEEEGDDYSFFQEG